MERKKPSFKRQHWYRYFRLGKTVKRKRKWRALHGGDSKMRLQIRGKAATPSIGWGSEKINRGKVAGLYPTRIENMNQLLNMKKGESIIIASIGKKKRMTLIEEANKKGIKILNENRRQK